MVPGVSLCHFNSSPGVRLENTLLITQGDVNKQRKFVFARGFSLAKIETKVTFYSTYLLSRV